MDSAHILGTLDFWFKLISMLTGVGILRGILRLVAWAIRLEPRIEHIEKASEGHSMILKELTMNVAEIEGRLLNRRRPQKEA